MTFTRQLIESDEKCDVAHLFKTVCVIMIDIQSQFLNLPMCAGGGDNQLGRSDVENDLFIGSDFSAGEKWGEEGNIEGEGRAAISGH